MKYASGLLFILLFFLAAIPISVWAQQKQETRKSVVNDSIKVTLYKTPGCQCCSKWAAYIEENGFSVREIPSDTLAAVKDHYHVPKNLRACHTAVTDGYVVEGHVPIESIREFLKTRPDAQGVAVPGMPAGSPGMGQDGATYKVFLFNKQGSQSVFGKY